MQAEEIESFANKTELVFWSYPKQDFNKFQLILLELIILPALHYQGLNVFFNV